MARRVVRRTAASARALLAVLLLAGALLFTNAASAATTREPRLALVIANSAYASFDRLGATHGDGDRIASALSATGFKDASGAGAVTPRRDLTMAQMMAAIAEFRMQLAAAGPDAFGVLYFSGHGAALGSYGDVMLLPVDVTRDLGTGAERLTRAELTRSLLGSGARNVLVVLDMCRSAVNAAPAAVPLDTASGSETRSGTKGLARIVRAGPGAARPDQGYLVAYSTSADQLAFDDGVFSKVLAEEIRRPQQSIADALKRTSDRVALKPGKSFQKPTFDYGLQGSPPCFVSCDSAAEGRFYDCANCPYMRVVPAGTALLGSPTGEAKRGGDEQPPHEVVIARPFALGVYEVTAAEWAACVRDKACRPITGWAKENPNPLIPAAGVSYEDAQAFVAWLSVQSGLAYRLPTEEEWEYAARGGATTAFAWGDEISPSDANYDQTASYRGSSTAPYRGYPEAVNAYPANAFGLYQMAGNVWELTQGCQGTPCQQRVARGGSFESTPAELRAANRFGVAPNKRRGDTGLRVARDLRADEAG